MKERKGGLITQNIGHASLGPTNRRVAEFVASCRRLQRMELESIPWRDFVEDIQGKAAGASGAQKTLSK